MKNYLHSILTTIMITTLALITASCNSNAGSISAMNSRYNDFLKILPSDLRDDFLINSTKYSADYKRWQDEANLWIDNIISEENIGADSIKANYQPDTKLYNIGILTNKFYERKNPYELMEEVYAHTQKLGADIAKLEMSDQDFSNKLHHLKVDEAIINFDSEETAFYYLWNYTLMLERPRRFQ